MTKQFKVGDKVRILDVNKIDYGREHWENGDVTYVTKIEELGGENKVHLSRIKTKYTIHDPFLHQRELRYIEKVSDKPTKNQRIKALEDEVKRLDKYSEGLRGHLTEALKRIESLEKAQSTTSTQNIAVKSDVDVSKVADTLAKSILERRPKPITPNQARKEIIEEAKVFVAKVTANMNDDDFDAKEGNGTYKYYNTKPEFIVNVEKRTVVALVKGAYNPKLFEKAIAKCAPDDVFNADIGKAIALGRALGLDVSRFEQAVKPTEVVVGHAIRSQTNAGNTFEYRNVTEVVGGKIWGFDTLRGHNAFIYMDAVARYGEWAKAVIIDDTEAQYE